MHTATTFHTTCLEGGLLNSGEQYEQCGFNSTPRLHDLHALRIIRHDGLPCHDGWGMRNFM